MVLGQRLLVVTPSGGDGHVLEAVWADCNGETFTGGFGGNVDAARETAFWLAVS